MKNKIIILIHQEKSKIILFLAFYIIFSELIKTKAEIYILEQSLELKLLLFSLAVVMLYKVPDKLIIISIIFLLLLSIFGVQTGFMIYAFVFYSFLGLLKEILK
ncbi:MAG: hypothetical protein UV07_C0003G0011 [Candidatus Azambacteria bacterium GW2011_GWB1_42_17]|uniref:Uncharacterized protein n=1 Tax=Candidatus Azambacteria bacterium GW2011_GWB1_42_17 TaxID=1618615 RepID=A0A0G1BEI4_9BACT|nr:MAG: hypothetical protein UV07_C0003G0011 [Candidatus Azambacteria bacterium GW2011_GWB1_42_17]